MPVDENVKSTPPSAHGIAPSRPGRGSQGGEEIRAASIKRMILIAAVIAIVVIGTYIPIYFQVGAWQILGDVGGVALALLCLVVAYHQAQHDRLDTAGYWILGAVFATYAAGELFWSGATFYFALSGLLLMTLAASVIRPSKPRIWLLAGGLYLVLILTVSRLGLLPRFEISQSPSLNFSLIIFTVVLLLAVLWQAGRAYYQIGTIRTRLLTAFLGVVVVPILVLSIGTVFGVVQGTVQQLTNQLESVAILKESEINTWLENLQFDLVLAMTGDEVAQRVIVLLQEPDPSDYPIGYSVLQTRFQQVIQDPGRFEELYLMDLKGTVVLSTDPAQEGKIYADETNFQRGLLGPYVQPPFFSLSRGETSVVAVRPVLNIQGETIGVLAGRANLTTLDAIMGERAGLGTTGETYLVGADYALLTQNRFGETEIPIRTTASNQAIEEQAAGSDTYNNYRQVSVVGSYRWLPELQVALVAEQEQTEAFQGLYLTLGIMVGIALLSALLAAIVALFVTRDIANPLSNLASTASEIAAGNLGQVAEVARDDEIGALAQAFNAMTAQLRDLIAGLEQRVADRTTELEQRSAYLEGAAAVGRAAASILDTESLISQVVELICQQFDLYYVSLFLVNEAGDYAELRASAGQTGQPLPPLGLRLDFGPGSMIGWSITHQQVRVALEAEKDTERLVQPELPDTRSEAALPLISAGEVLGALNVQHTQPGFFDQDIVVVLQTMADQVAVALVNARLFTEREAALEATQRVYGELSREAWIELLREQPDLGFRCDERGTTPAADTWRPEMIQALQTGQTVQGNGDGSEGRLLLAVPIRIRGQVVGVLDTYKPAEAGGWTREEVVLLEAVAAQLDTALESARLFQDTQRRAGREQAIRQITEQMRRAVDVEAILQTTVAELAKAMGAPRAYVRLGTEFSASTRPAASREEEELETDS